MSPPEIAGASREFLDLMCGKHLGAGCFRSVFTLRTDSEIVVKIQTDPDRVFENIKEWEVWQFVEGRSIAKWFAPCLHISATGQVLLQKRTRPLLELPPKLPNFFDDVKLDNFGSIGNQIACHDYSFTLRRLMEKGVGNTRLVKVQEEMRRWT